MAMRWPDVVDLEQAVDIPAGEATLRGVWRLPAASDRMVIFVHGSGSSRHSPRNQFVAQALHDDGIGTLLMDLLTEEEEEADDRTGHLRFDIRLLARRVVRTTEWVATTGRRLSIGYFGASTGAAAALVAAAELPAAVRAVVSRGGRPDLAFPYLSRVLAPTLLIVGERDSEVLALNEQAFAVLPGEKQIEIVPGASHLFEGPGALEDVARRARRWFENHLGS